MTIPLEARLLRVLHLLGLIGFFGGARAFNLETRLPVIKQGHNGSYFGYAVAAHQIRNDPVGPATEGL